jgi:hypothetical protein
MYDNSKSFDPCNKGRNFDPVNCNIQGIGKVSVDLEVKTTNASVSSGFKPTNNLTKAAKFDSHKTRAGLVLNNIPNALLAVSEVGTFGASKYAPNNWKGLSIERLEDALQRHLLAHYLGEVNDAESGLTHLAHAVWNLVTILELTLLEDKKKQDASER